jgi:hypothetical protein
VDVRPNVEEALAYVLAARSQKGKSRERQFNAISFSLIAVTLAIAVPTVRIVAQDLYAQLAVRTFGVTPKLPTDLPQELLLPNVFPMGPAAPGRPMPLAEAQAHVPFRIKLPKTDLLPYQPELFVHEATALSRRIDSASIDLALKRLGRDSVEMPIGLDGMTVTVAFHEAVTIRLGHCPELVGPWHSCALLNEAVAPTIAMPQGVEPEALTVFSLELLGLRAADAEALSRTGTMFFPPENYAWHKVVNVNGDDAVLVGYQPGATGQVAYNLCWTDNGIAYSLFGRDPNMALTVAASLR